LAFWPAADQDANPKRPKEKPGRHGRPIRQSKFLQLVEESVCYEKELSMTILVWIVVGLIAGLVANAIVPGNSPGGLLMTILLGIVGAFVGSLLAVALDISEGLTGFDLHTIVVAVCGAVVVLLAYRLLSGRGGLRT
jgi:uncharacterized membrane protein YeaQ/YmgE (transglycosylase-associated protein family)